MFVQLYTKSAGQLTLDRAEHISCFVFLYVLNTFGSNRGNNKKFRTKSCTTKYYAFLTFTLKVKEKKNREWEFYMGKPASGECLLYALSLLLILRTNCRTSWMASSTIYKDSCDTKCSLQIKFIRQGCVRAGISKGRERFREKSRSKLLGRKHTFSVHLSAQRSVWWYVRELPLSFALLGLEDLVFI